MLNIRFSNRTVLCSSGRTKPSVFISSGVMIVRQASWFLASPSMVSSSVRLWPLARNVSRMCDSMNDRNVHVCADFCFSIVSISWTYPINGTYTMRSKLASGAHISGGRLACAVDAEALRLASGIFRSLDMSDTFRRCSLPWWPDSWWSSAWTTEDLSNLNSAFFLELELQIDKWIQTYWRNSMPLTVEACGDWKTNWCW